MTKTETKLRKFVDAHRGELCLDGGGELVRLVDLYEETNLEDMDWYYKVQSLSPNDPSGYQYDSCVGWLIPLGGKLAPKAYKYLANMFNHNWKGTSV